MWSFEQHLTHSNFRYVIEILKKLNRREEDITKVQIGGPDGDLGSNEILISKDKTIAIVDKSGVVWFFFRVCISLLILTFSSCAGCLLFILLLFALYFIVHSSV